MIILAQLIFVTLRSACFVGLDVLSLKNHAYLVNDDGSIRKLIDDTVSNVELVFQSGATLSGRAMEVLANAVLVWRAYALYSDLLWIRSIVIVSWVIDFAVQVFYFGAYMEMSIILAKGLHLSTQLSHIALYASRWTSFALNMLVTLLIAYRTWKFKNVLKDAGLGTKKSTAYHILARLVETGVLLLAVQLLVAILATSYTSVDPAAPNYIAMTILAELGVFVINAHPAAMSLVSAHIVSMEGQSSRHVESTSVVSNLAFRVTESGLSADHPIISVPSVYTEK
ncbi:hypothetical protein DL96DRAFT_1821511 [Flagelloscypha sp. PMI_526]|nr:hypothetical protein DL96DRAFT_1821511 [Flagelloscypha sp. PMI_526]